MTHQKSTEIANYLEKGNIEDYSTTPQYTSTPGTAALLGLATRRVFSYLAQSETNTVTEDAGQKNTRTQKATKTNWQKRAPRRTTQLHSRCDSWLKKFPKPKAASNWKSTPKYHIALFLYPFFSPFTETKRWILGLTEHSCQALSRTFAPHQHEGFMSISTNARY